jgi:acyl carrier protein
MVALEDRLLQCFHSIFPDQPEAVLRTANPDILEKWDSMNHILLLHVVEEEFSIRIPENAAGELLSFEDFANYLRLRPEL